MSKRKQGRTPRARFTFRSHLRFYQPVFIFIQGSFLLLFMDRLWNSLKLTFKISVLSKSKIRLKYCSISPHGFTTQTPHFPSLRMEDSLQHCFSKCGLKPTGTESQGSNLEIQIPRPHLRPRECKVGGGDQGIRCFKGSLCGFNAWQSLRTTH